MDDPQLPTDEHELALAGLAPAALERLDAVLLGPGLGSTSEAEGRAEAGVWQRLQAFPGLLLLDADGLNRLAGGLHGEATAWLRGRGGPTWLTPHAGEFRRLFPELAALPALEAAQAAARASGATVLRKGARSVIATPDGRCWQLAAASGRVARAGLGDVLAGYAAARGAQALAALAAEDRYRDGGGSGSGGDGAFLAAAALEHATAGLNHGGTPLGVAEALQIENCTHSQAETGRKRHGW